MLAFYPLIDSKPFMLKFPNDEGYDSEAQSYLNYIDISGIKPLRMVEGEPALNRYFLVVFTPEMCRDTFRGGCFDQLTSYC